MNTKIIAIMFVLALVGCTAPAGEVASQPVLKIGVIGSLTSVGAFFGQQEIKGLELAKDEINANGGVNDKMIELVIEDSKTDPAASVTALQKLINVDGVEFVIGDSWTSTTAVLVPIANANEILMISPISALDDQSQDDLFFRTMPVIEDLTAPLADYAYNVMGIRNVGVLFTDTPWGVEHTRDFKLAFEKLGGRIVGEERFDLNAIDVRSELTKLGAQNPDAILNIGASGPNLGIPIRQAQELGINVKWLTSVAAENAPLVKEYGELVSGLTYPYPYDINSNLPSVQTFIASYKAKYNETPDNTAANSYDALKVLATAIEQSGEDPLEVKKAILAMKDFPGGSGLLSFDQNGDVKKEILIKQVKGGKFVRIQ